MKPVLRYLEIHLTDHCNLNCKGCCHFAPIAIPWFADLNIYARDMRRLQEIFSTITTIRLMGGEPLLHPQVETFLSVTRWYFPRSKIEVLTNGILLDRMPDSFWNGCRKFGVGVSVTLYPPVAHQRSFFAMSARDRGVAYECREVSGFWARMNLRADSDPEQSFRQCRSWDYTPNLRAGRLYICYVIPVIHHFNRRYGTCVPESSFLDIHDPRLTGWDVLAFLDRHADTCQYCSLNRHWFGWASSRQAISEWDVDARREGGKCCI